MGWIEDRVDALVASCQAVDEDVYERAVQGRPRIQTVLRAAAQQLGLKRGRTRQAEVLALIAAGLTDRQIALALGCSVDTVSTHMKRALVALEAVSRAEAIAIVLQGALATPPAERRRKRPEAPAPVPEPASRPRVYDPVCWPVMLMVQAQRNLHELVYGTGAPDA